MSLFSLTSPGDTFTATMDRAEQVAAITDVAVSIAGETASRTATVEFAASTDNTTWAAWVTLSAANLSALVLDPDLPIYRRYRITRGGADTTGSIDVDQIVETFTIDPSAEYGHGIITDTGIYADISAVIEAAISGCLYQHNGADHYEVRRAGPESCSPTDKPIIYWHRLSIDMGEADSVGSYADRIRFRLGISRCSHHLGYADQLGQLLALFNPHRSTLAFDVTLNGTDRVGVTFSDLGVRVKSRGNTLEFEGEEGIYMHEFEVQMTINYKETYLWQP